MTLALLAGAVLLGAATQRLTGMGFALVSAPLLVAIVGPLTGVQLLQVFGVIASLLVVAQVWRDVEVRKALLLLVPALVGIVPGAHLARTLPAPVLAIVVGGMVVVALLAVVLSERARVFTGTGGLLSAGLLSGFMNASAGVGGPAVVLYAVSTDWAHRTFVATVQLYFAALAAASLVALGWPSLDAPTWGVALGAMVVGLGLGHVLAQRVRADVARALMIGVALTGAVVTVVKGAVELAS